MQTTTAKSAHVDTFARDRLPPLSEQPEFLFDLPELQFPDRLNCAAELLDRWVLAGDAHRTCVINEQAAWSYGELQARANQIARVLVEDFGLLPGNRVLVRGGNSPQLAACWLAIVKAGGIVVASMPLLRARELTEIVTKAQITHAVCDSRLLSELTSAQAHCPTLKHVVCYGGSTAELEQRATTKPHGFINVDTAADDVCMIAFTSGTTGKPKATVHFHRDVMAACACWPRHVLQANRDDVFIGSPPLAFTFGLGGLLLFPLSIGASSVLIEKPNPERLLQSIGHFRATVCFTAPTSYRAMAPAAKQHDLSSLRKCVSAAEPLPMATRRLWKEATGIDLIDGIGTTELLHIFLSHRDDDVMPGATGRPVPGYAVCVVDDHLRPVAPGTVGRLAVKGPTGCRYLEDERQREYVRNGWNLTGDAYLVDDAGWFVYQARVDDMIVSSGYNIAGAEVESALLEHPAVAECAAIGVPDSRRGQLVKAFVVLRSGFTAGAALVDELQAFVKRTIAPYKYPRAIEFIDALPRTESGKVQRYRLRDGPAVARAANDGKTALLPPGWPRPIGYANGVAAEGTLIFVAGQVGWNTKHEFDSDDLAGQVRQALVNVVAVLAEGGATPAHLTRMTWYLTDLTEYRREAKVLGAIYREIIGTYSVAMTAVHVSGLVEPRAKVEIEATAVVPRRAP